MHTIIRSLSKLISLYFCHPSTSSGKTENTNCPPVLPELVESLTGLHKKSILALSFILFTPILSSTKEEALANATRLEEQGQYQEAHNILEELQVQYPHDIPLAYKAGCFYASIGNMGKALTTFKSLLALSPENSVQTMYNIGYVFKTAGYVNEAIEWYTKALEIDPQYEAAQFALGLAHLYKGDFEHGWKLHEKHLIAKQKNADTLRNFIRTNTIQGKIILIRPDGGMGDMIQFIRYAQLLKNLGARVIAAVQHPLVPLLSRCPYLDQVVSAGDQLPLCHDWCAVMSLPAVFNSTEQTIPRNIPYLYPDEKRSSYWKEYLTSTNAFKIGICWQADVHNDSSRPPFARRGIPLKKLLSISQIPGTHLYSLQQKDGLEQAKDIPIYRALTIFDATFDTAHGAFMDTAAIIPHLDLIITVDTAVAHIAGALGARVWLLLPYCTDWRWIVGRSDSPWYPSMRIFKQHKPFDWESVMEEVKNELEKVLAREKLG